MKEDKETALINISVITTDKSLSKSIVNKYCDETINYLNNEEQSSVKQSITFTIARLDVVRKNLLKAENEIVEFQDENATISSPFLSMQLRRKTKNMELVRSVVVLLEKQLELLKIEEVRDRPIINILDAPDVRDKPVKPKKRDIVMINTILSFIMSYLIVILHEKAIKYRIYSRLKKEILSH